MPGKMSYLPHLYVIRGYRNEKVGFGEATFPEYVAALCKMSKSSEVPASWKEPIFNHIHQLATMACDWEWETCRLWSERVFVMIDDGRLPHGWDDQYAINDVRYDVALLGVRINNNHRR